MLTIQQRKQKWGSVTATTSTDDSSSSSIYRQTDIYQIPKTEHICSGQTRRSPFYGDVESNMSMLIEIRNANDNTRNFLRVAEVWRDTDRNLAIYISAPPFPRPVRRWRRSAACVVFEARTGGRFSCPSRRRRSSALSRTHSPMLSGTFRRSVPLGFCCRVVSLLTSV